MAGPRWSTRCAPNISRLHQVQADPCDGRAVARGRDKLEALPTYVDNLRWAADRLAAQEGVTAIIGSINTARHPRLLPQHHGAGGCRSSRRSTGPTYECTIDLYHLQIMRGDLAPTIRELAGTCTRISRSPARPGRHEPDIGEINALPVFVRSARRESATTTGSAASTGRKAARSPGRLGKTVRDRLIPPPRPSPARG